jgi:hypothetical protein
MKKGPFVKLLDLLYGWAEYNQLDYENHKDEKLTEDILDLYQKASSLSEKKEPSIITIGFFIIRKILPLVLK